MRHHNFIHNRPRARFLPVLLALGGCVGSIGDPPDAKLDGTDSRDPRLDARVWRLTPAQYNNEVQRFFPGAPTVNLPEGSSEFGLSNISLAARIDQGNASQFIEAARTIGVWVSAQGAAPARCATFGTPECLDTLLGWLPAAAYRRDPTAAELAELRAVYDDTAPTYGASWAFSAVVRSVLLSPQFLYRSEIGPPGTGVVVEIDDDEIASLLSFALTDLGPDAALLADAKAKRLHDPEVRVGHVRRLMSGTAPIFQRFFWEWLKMSTLESQGNETGLDPALVAALHDEFKAYVSNIVVKEKGTLADLLTTTHTWATPEVAAYYGVTHPGSGVQQFELDPAERGGLLTLGAWLVSHGKKGRDNVVRRGMAVYRDAMCNDITPLNVDLEEAQAKLVGPDATVKEIAAARSADGTCGGCHRTSDPVGLAFENFAGDGKWQTIYPDGKPVEASVVLNEVAYDTAPKLAAGLAADVPFQQCFVQRFGHFVMGADFGSPVKVRASTEAFDAFVASGGSLEELLVAIVRDRSFIERKK